MQKYVTEKEAASYLGLKPTTLTKWRWAGQGPTFHKLGRAIRYTLPELDTFVASGR